MRYYQVLSMKRVGTTCGWQYLTFETYKTAYLALREARQLQQASEPGRVRVFLETVAGTEDNSSVTTQLIHEWSK